jgi:putative AbiEi antitoxin of type IV toxin-antitoxin system
MYTIREFIQKIMVGRSASLADARNTSERHHGMLRTREALRLGIHSRTLYAVRDSGELVPLAEDSIGWQPLLLSPTPIRDRSRK